MPFSPIPYLIPFHTRSFLKPDAISVATPSTIAGYAISSHVKKDCPSFPSNLLSAIMKSIANMYISEGRIYGDRIGVKSDININIGARITESELMHVRIKVMIQSVGQ